MRKTQFIVLPFFLLVFGFVVNAQKYKDLMADPSYNVYDVIKEGNLYFKNKDKGKGSGYKQFQRWVLLNEDLYYPSGDRSLTDPKLSYFIGLAKNQKEKQIKLMTSKASNSAQVNNPIEESEWLEVGPFVELKEPFSEKRNGNGRVDAIWVDPNNDNRIYIGCRGGGLWITTNGGQSWSPKTDYLGITGVWSIAVNPTNINEIYIATSVGGSGNYSIGIFKSSDGGDNWQPTGYALDIASTFVKINKIIIDPSNPSVLYAATSNGLLKSTDGFANYNLVYSGNITDIEFKPGDSNVLYIVNKSQNTLFKSTDAAANFSATTVTGSDLQVAVTPANSDYVYAVGDGVSFRSIDNGSTFSQTGVPDNGTGQYGGFGVSDTDPDLVINGSLDTYVSNNGSLTYNKATYWIYSQSTGVGGNFVHADIREVEVVNGTIYLGTDGWLVKSTDGGVNYEILTNTVGNHEIYQHGMGVSQSNDHTLVVGTQDNGTSIWYEGNWNHWKGGDGGTSMVDYSNHNIIYGSLYNGDFKRTDTGGLTSNKVDLGDTKPGTLPPLIQHPTEPATIFLGEGNGAVWKSTNRGSSWTELVNLPTSDVIDELAISPSDPNYIYTSVKERIWKTTDGGANWTEITSSLPYRVIKGIAVDYNDPNHVAVCFTGYSATDKSYITTDGGQNWTNISTGLPNLATSDIVFDDASTNALYIATDIGVYYRDDSLTQWQPFGLGMPNVVVNDLEIQHNTQRLYAATWGRGVWSAELVGEESPPSSNFQADSQVIYEGETVAFSDTTTGYPTTWSWTFEGGTPSTSNDENPEIVYTTAGLYAVTLTTTNSFGSNTKEVTDYITVNEPLPPIADFEADSQEVFQGNYLSFTDTSTNIPTSWSWSFEGGTPSTSDQQNPLIQYTTIGSYKVTLTVTNEFGTNTKEVDGYVTVTENQGSGPLQAHFNFQSDLTDSSSYQRDLIAVGNQTITYVNDKEGNPESAININSQYFENSYTGIGGTGERTVTAWIKTSTVGSRKTIVSWGENLTGQMWNVMVDDGNIRVEGGTCNVQNDDSTVTPLDNDMWRHIAVTYNPSDGTTMNSIKLYIDGVYYTNQPDSGDSYNSESVTINTSTAINLRVGSSSYNSNYDWIGDLDDIRVYSRALSGDEIVTVMNEVPDTPPVANFIANADSIFIEESVEFTDTSSGNPTSWAWVFEEGIPSTSNEQFPSVTYYSPGTYDVSLTVTNELGTDTKIVEDYITVEVPPPPSSDFEASSTSVWVGEQISFTDLSSENPTDWEWSFPGGTPNSSSAQNPEIVYNSPGVYSVSLSTSNFYGSDTELKDNYITVTEPVVVDVQSDNYTVAITSESCVNSNNGRIQITALADYNYEAVITGNGYNQSTSFGVSAPLNIENLNAGTYSICIYVENAPDYEQCFSVVIKEPESLSVFSKVNYESNTVSIDLSGSNLYYIDLNGQIITTTDQNIILDLDINARNVLKIFTNKSCQGVYKEVFNLNDINQFYPNPVFSEITIVLSAKSQSSNIVSVYIHDYVGQLVFSKSFKEMKDKLTINVNDLASGAYIISINANGTLSNHKMIKQ